MRPRAPLAAAERGSGTVLVLLLVALLGLGMAVGGSVASVTLARHRAQSAADLAALVGAARLPPTASWTPGLVRQACRDAADTSARNRAELIRCQPAGASLLVEVRVTGHPLGRWWPRHDLVVTARARAGRAGS